VRIHELDTPVLLIDRDIMEKNLRDMQEYADSHGVSLRPHTKTHKMPALAMQQQRTGARGITVAKVGEAEVMAKHGLDDIFIANEIVGVRKLERIRELARSVDISFGVDTPCQVEAAEEVFASAGRPAQVLVEIEVGENRSGIIEEEDFLALLKTIQACPHVRFKGVFSHDGNSYSAPTQEECRRISVIAQKRTLEFATLASKLGMKPETVSVGSTPSMMTYSEIVEGVTEIRPGTYIFMDACQANVIGTLDRCAATVLATVISRPTEERVILDVGAKGLTMQTRSEGICSTKGRGTLPEYPGVTIDSVYDEHAIIYDREFRRKIAIGDRVRIIPVHICPVCNLYDTAFLVSGDEVIGEIPVLCRGKLQ
jgi:D-serine deaminase-like pyridoxal phosphate-dependent protein